MVLGCTGPTVTVAPFRPKPAYRLRVWQTKAILGLDTQILRFKSAHLILFPVAIGLEDC